MKIVHVLQSDKFTSGYVNFMKKHMSAYEHYFLLQSSAPLPLWDAHRVFYVETFNAPLSDDLRAVLEQCDRIIFSGVFSSIYLLQHFLNNNFESLNYQRLSVAAVMLFAVIFALVAALYALQSRYGEEAQL